MSKSAHRERNILAYRFNYRTIKYMMKTFITTVLRNLLKNIFIIFG